jgi:Bacteriophage HK97-gp10, putative tail-component
MVSLRREFRLEFDPGEPDRFLNDPTGGVALDLEKRAQRVARSARRRAPKKTGELRSEIRSEMGSDEEGVYADVVSPRDSFQEKGHRAVDGTRVSPRRYLRPALYAGQRRRR